MNSMVSALMALPVWGFKTSRFHTMKSSSPKKGAMANRRPAVFLSRQIVSR